MCEAPKYRVAVVAPVCSLLINIRLIVTQLHYHRSVPKQNLTTCPALEHSVCMYLGCGVWGVALSTKNRTNFLFLCVREMEERLSWCSLVVRDEPPTSVHVHKLRWQWRTNERWNYPFCDRRDVSVCRLLPTSKCKVLLRREKKRAFGSVPPNGCFGCFPIFPRIHKNRRKQLVSATLRFVLRLRWLQGLRMFAIGAQQRGTDLHTYVSIDVDDSSSSRVVVGIVMKALLRFVCRHLVFFTVEDGPENREVPVTAPRASCSVGICFTMVCMRPGASVQKGLGVYSAYCCSLTQQSNDLKQ